MAFLCQFFLLLVFLLLVFFDAGVFFAGVSWFWGVLCLHVFFGSGVFCCKRVFVGNILGLALVLC